MNIHVTNPNNPLIRAMLFTVPFDENQEMVDDPAHADVIIADRAADIKALYAEYGAKFFLLFDTIVDRVEWKEEPNIFAVGRSQLESGLLQSAVSAVKKYCAWASAQNTDAVQPNEVSEPFFDDIVLLSRAYTVLVVDDKPGHLETAMCRLVGQQIVLADTPAKALQLLKLEDGDGSDSSRPSIDAVLTDLNMKPDQTYPSLALDRYGPNEEVPAGFSLMFEATKRGIPVAIVTDANHHVDWFSAMFDHHKGAVVNGQQVLFCQAHGTKRWDEVLKRLMEPAESSSV